MSPAVSRWVRQDLAKIPLPDWYGLCVAALLGGWLIGRLVKWCVERLVQVEFLITVWRFFCSWLPRPPRRLDVGTYRETIMAVALLAVNILAVALWTHAWHEVQRRAGVLAVVHMVLLWASPSFGLVAETFGVERKTVAWLHRWVGRFCVLHSLLHASTAMALTGRRAHSLAHMYYYIPLLAVIAISLIVPFSLHAVLRRHPQFALKTHYLLALTSAVTLALHLWESRSVCFWYLVGAVGLWWLSSVISCLLLPLWKKRWGYPWPRLNVRMVQELLWLDIDVPRHWDIYPGQYVQLWVPQIGLRYVLQLPLFYIAFWEDTPDGDHRKLHILTRPRESGLTAELCRSIALHHREHRILVLGPYGRQCDLLWFGTVLFVVEDVGFLRVLPYIRMLVQASQHRRAMVRQLMIFWQMEDFDHQRWVSNWMQQLLDIDRGEFKILKFYLYYRRSREDVPRPSDAASRIHRCPGQLDPGQRIQEQIKSCHGNMAVGVCASPSIREKVVEKVQSQCGRDIRLLEFPVEPYHRWQVTGGESSATASDHEMFITSRIVEGQPNLLATTRPRH